MGKTTMLLILFSLSLLISLSNAASPPKVLDIKGNDLRSSASYYILPLIRGRGGGLIMSSASESKSCPLDQIVQDRLEVNDGLPLKFSPVNTTKPGLVRESTDLNIKFLAASICGHSTVWRLGDYDESKKIYFLMTGGVEGNPGSQTISNWFKIEKFDNKYYKLQFCPTVCNYCKVICRDVGVYVEGKGGKRRLGLSLSNEIQPFPVFFKKA